MRLFSLRRWTRPGDRRRTRGRDAGQSLVEMALALPILLALLIGIVEMGRAWNVRQVLVNTAREGARIGVLPLPRGTTADVQATVEARLGDAALDLSIATITITGADGGTDDPVSVQISYPYEFLFLGPVVDLLGGGGSVPGSINLSTTATMRHE